MDTLTSPVTYSMAFVIFAIWGWFSKTGSIKLAARLATSSPPCPSSTAKKDQSTVIIEWRGLIPWHGGLPSSGDGSDDRHISASSIVERNPIMSVLVQMKSFSIDSPVKTYKLKICRFKVTLFSRLLESVLGQFILFLWQILDEQIGLEIASPAEGSLWEWRLHEWFPSEELQ